MTVITEIQNAMASVLSVLGDPTWQYRALTSAYDVRPPTYGSPVSFTAHAVQGTILEEFDEKRGAYVRRARQVLKCSESIVLHIGDQVIDPTGKHWHVDGNVDSALAIDGITRYSISRDVALKGAAGDRGGAV